MANKVENIEAEIIKNYELGTKEYINSKYYDAIALYEKVIKLATDEKYCDYLARSIEGIGHCYKSIANNFFDKAEEEFIASLDGGFNNYCNTIEYSNKAIKYLKQAKKMFKRNEVAEKIGKEKTKIYINRCEDIIFSLNCDIERSSERIELVK